MRCGRGKMLDIQNIEGYNMIGDNLTFFLIFEKDSLEE